MRNVSAPRLYIRLGPVLLRGARCRAAAGMIGRLALRSEENTRLLMGLPALSSQGPISAYLLLARAQDGTFTTKGDLMAQPGGMAVTRPPLSNSPSHSPGHLKTKLALCY
ncbi:hypothetical protein NDU88_001118 [Pleurodeles waltl]|uniref:Uncharacterized protein n=1 Tax=Pleurodeles waltl TaxID=8319 RepID=A0AAV7V8L9_PLEWA|nr:hypothetical protein NDU88_001118 [Pleurodeles waltl]